MLRNKWNFRPVGAKKLKVSQKRVQHFLNASKKTRGGKPTISLEQARVLASKEKTISNFFNRNKWYIKERLSVPFPNATDSQLKKIFVQNAMEGYGGKGTTAKAMIERLIKTETFKSAKERLAENALEGLRKDKDALENVRRITGWNEKLDPSRFLYNKETHGYEYSTEKGAATIYFDNSPKKIRVVDTSKEVFQL